MSLLERLSFILIILSGAFLFWLTGYTHRRFEEARERNKQDDQDEDQALRNAIEVALAERGEYFAPIARKTKLNEERIEQLESQFRLMDKNLNQARVWLNQQRLKEGESK